jgi:hypothetical protein
MNPLLNPGNEIQLPGPALHLPRAEGRKQHKERSDQDDDDCPEQG